MTLHIQIGKGLCLVSLIGWVGSASAAVQINTVDVGGTSIEELTDGTNTVIGRVGPYRFTGSGGPPYILDINYYCYGPFIPLALPGSYNGSTLVAEKGTEITRQIANLLWNTSDSPVVGAAVYEIMYGADDGVTAGTFRIPSFSPEEAALVDSYVYNSKYVWTHPGEFQILTLVSDDGRNQPFLYEQTVPEPSTLALLGASMLGFGLVSRRRRRNR